MIDDKKLRDSYLSVDDKLSTSLDGWVAVASSLKRRARVRKTVYASGIALSISLLLVSVQLLRRSRIDLNTDALMAWSAPQPSYPSDLLDEPGLTLDTSGVFSESFPKKSKLIAQNVEMLGEQTTSAELPLVETEGAEAAFSSGSEHDKSIDETPAIVEGSNSSQEIGEEGSSSSQENNTKSTKTTTNSISVGELSSFKSKEKTRRIRLSLALSASGAPGSNFESGDSYPIMSDASCVWAAPNPSIQRFDTERQRLVYENAQFCHYMPIGAGLSVSLSLTDALGIETGLQYTLLRSELQYASGYVGQQMQSLHMLGLPLRLRWDFLRSRYLSAYLSAGPQIERCLYATLDGQRQQESGLQFSLSANAGVQWSLSSHLGLFLQPEFSYYLTQTSLKTIRSEQSFDMGVRLGLRFSL